MPKANPEFIAKILACTTHARDLVVAAQSVLAVGKPNIAYHLAVLSLEELGRRNLLGMLEVANEYNLDPAYARKRLDDHVQKLFWAFFGGPLFKKRMTPKDLEEAQSLSRFFHGKRLAGLYVDTTDNGLNVPSEAISHDEAKSVVGLAEALTELAEGSRPREELTDDDIARTQWFMSAADDDELKRYMFSKEGMDKLRDFEEITDWVDWLKGEVAENERLGAEAAKRELERTKALPAVGTKPKWKIRFRIKSASHSIRSNAFTEWNKHFPNLQLQPVGNKKPEVLVELTLLDNVPLQGLYHHAWGIARHFVVALNIATLGFFWWEFAQDRLTWYERIDDLGDIGMSLKLEANTGRIDWGGKRALGQEDMARVIPVFAALPIPPFDEPREYSAMDAYVSGLTYLGSCSVHLPLWADAIGHFVKSLQRLMEECGDWEPGNPFEPALVAFLEGRAGELDGREELLAVVRAFDASVATGKPATGPNPKGEHASYMKLFCDWYFMEKAQPLALDRIRAGGAE